MKKTVFAHYFIWFGTKEISGRWSHWDWKDSAVEHDPDKILERERRDIASFYYPMIGPYDSSSEKVLSYHCELAKAAFIDAFTVDWYGPEDEKHTSTIEREIIRNPVVDRNFKKLLAAAEKTEFQVSICYEEKILTNARVLPDEAEAVKNGKRHFRYVAENYFSSPGYWKSDGRPVVVIWGNHSLSARAWAEILSEIKSWNPWVLFSHHCPLQNSVLESKGLVDAFYPWMNIKNVEGQQADLEDFYRFARGAMAKGGTTLFGAGAWPSFNDTGVRGWGAGSRVIPDPANRLHDLTWKFCLGADPDVVSIATWNDWNEGSVIEPCRELGYRRLDETRKYARRLKGLPPEAFDFSQIPL